MINIGVKFNTKEEKLKKKKGKRNGVVGRALPSNCKDGGGGRGKEKFNNYFIIHFLNNLLKMTL